MLLVASLVIIYFASTRTGLGFERPLEKPATGEVHKIRYRHRRLMVLPLPYCPILQITKVPAYTLSGGRCQEATSARTGDYPGDGAVGSAWLVPGLVIHLAPQVGSPYVWF